MTDIERLTRAIERKGGRVLHGEFILRDGSKSNIYVDWPDGADEYIARPEVASPHEISQANADQAKELARLHAVIEYCLSHLDVAKGDASYIQSHVAIRLRAILDGDAASTYVGTLERILERQREKNERAADILREVLEEDGDILLNRDLVERIHQHLGIKQKELPLELPGKEANNPFQGGGAGGVPDGK